MDGQSSADYIRNDSSWYNSLAQSPSFIANRIMNSDKMEIYQNTAFMLHFIPL